VRDVMADDDAARWPGRRRFLSACGALGGIASARSGWAQAPELRFSGGTDGNDRRYRYAAELLQLALRRGGNDRVVRSVGGMTQARMAVEVAEGRMDVMLLPMSWPTNLAVMPIRLPLRRGLLGVRLLMARPTVAAAIGEVRSLDELRSRFSMGYGADWIDRPAFEPLGFRVVVGSSYSGLFDMLRAGRFDFLSRGVNEVWAEIDHPELGRGLTIVAAIALSYPLDDYFYVRNGNQLLHDQISLGLTRARADGSFDALFDLHHRDGLRRAALEQRTIFEIGGYPVEPGTPLELFDVLRGLRRAGGRS
jgi:hypothetical protein